MAAHSQNASTWEAETGSFGEFQDDNNNHRLAGSPGGGHELLELIRDSPRREICEVDMSGEEGGSGRRWWRGGGGALVISWELA